MAGAPHHALIIGAGIGGLCAALALARAGLQVSVIERASLFEDIGAGIQLSPNATLALEKLGVLERIAPFGYSPNAVSLRAYASGAEIARVPLDGAQARWGTPYLLIHRADLQRALLEQAALHPAITLLNGISVAGYAAGSDKVALALRRGLLRQEMTGDLLIGADGLRSIVRERLGFGDKDAPVYSGRTAWRAMIDAAAVPEELRAPETRLWLGPAAHLVHYPLRGGTLVNVVAVVQERRASTAAQDDWTTAGDPATLARSFARWPPLARALLDAAEGWRVWPLFERPAPPRWSDGRVALLGDAAHPMLPFMAQGAAQAIEDAVALGAAITAEPDIAKALAAYGRARARRAAKVVDQSKKQGRIYHLSGPAAFARNLVLRNTSPERLLARQDWLYGHKA